MLNKGGQRAPAGTYWNMVNGERVDLEREGKLPGTEKTAYLKAPGAAVLAAGPAAGLVYAAFLPLVGIVMTMAFFGGKILEWLVNAAAGIVTFGWRPIEAYLTGRKEKGSAGNRKDSPARKR